MPLSHSHLVAALDTFEALHRSLRRLIERVFQPVDPARWTDASVRADATAKLDRFLVADVPAAALVPAVIRQRLIEQMLSIVMDSLVPTDGGPAGVAPATGSTVLPPGLLATDSLGLGVRGIVIEANAGTAAPDLMAAIAPLAPNWALRAMAGLPNFYRLSPPSVRAFSVSEAWDLANLLRSVPTVRSAEPAIRQLPESITRTDGPHLSAFQNFGMQHHNVPETKNQPEWSLDRVLAQTGWPTSHQGSGVLIGHVDTGYTRHPEIVPSLDIAKGYDTWDDDSDSEDDLDPSFWDYLRATFPVANPGHGTGTSSVIASQAGLQAGHSGTHGVTGTGPRLTVIPIRATPTVVILPTGSAQEVAEGITIAVQRGAKVISMSLGSPWSSRDLQAAVNQALDAGVIVCAAAGNVVLFERWLTQVTYPARYDGVIAVAGCDYHGRPWRDSCRGPAVVVTAPGTDVWRASAEMNSAGQIRFGTERGSGTSFAVATVAGVAGCWLNRWGGWEKLRQDLGGDPRRIPWAFRECLRQHAATALTIPSSPPADLPGYPSFDAKDFGVGILNTETFFTVNPVSLAPPPPFVAASAALDSLAEAPDDVLAQLRDFLAPDAARHMLGRALAHELGLSAEELAAFLAENGREFLHHVATSADLRERLSALARATPAALVAGVAAPSAGPSIAATLAQCGSCTLARTLRLTRSAPHAKIP